MSPYLSSIIIASVLSLLMACGAESKSHTPSEYESSFSELLGAEKYDLPKYFLPVVNTDLNTGSLTGIWMITEEIYWNVKAKNTETLLGTAYESRINQNTASKSVEISFIKIVKNDSLSEVSISSCDPYDPIKEYLLVNNIATKEDERFSSGDIVDHFNRDVTELTFLNNNSLWGVRELIATNNGVTPKTSNYTSIIKLDSIITGVKLSDSLLFSQASEFEYKLVVTEGLNVSGANELLSSIDPECLASGRYFSLGFEKDESHSSHGSYVTATFSQPGSHDIGYFSGSIQGAEVALEIVNSVHTEINTGTSSNIAAQSCNADFSDCEGFLVINKNDEEGIKFLVDMIGNEGPIDAELSLLIR